jgi:pimeloyl-ACP methyl ester carboxylesterase
MPHLSAGGHRLEYAWLGPAPEDAPTLVFLHEGLGCVSTWRDFPARLADATGWGALVYSRAGYGGSDPVPLPRPLGFMHDEAVVLPEVMDAARVREAILVGHSDGASIALVHAGRDRPARVRALVLEAPHVFCEDVTVRSIEEAGVAYAGGGPLRRALERHHGANADVAFWGWNRAWLDPGFRDWNLEEFLPGIDVPVLVIQGHDDAYGTLRQLDAIEAGAAARVQRLVLADCGHAPHRDQPERVLEAMAAFVREVLA